MGNLTIGLLESSYEDVLWCTCMDQEPTLKDVLEVVEFIKDNSVFRDELEERLANQKSEIVSHIDGFIVLHQKLDTELAALRAKYDRLEGFVQQLAKHAQIELEY